MPPRLASRLVDSCLRLLTALLEQDRDPGKDKLMKDQPALHEVFARLKIWALNYDVEGDLLDRILDFSEHLKEPTISLLADLVECLLYYESGVRLLEYTEGNLREELNMLLGDTGRDQLKNEEYGHEEFADDEDSELQLGSQGSECSDIDNLQDILDSLYKLSPALDFFLENFSPTDRVEATDYHELLTRHKFPVAKPYLIQRLVTRIRESRKKLEQPASFQAEVPTSSNKSLFKNAVQRSRFGDSGIGSSVPTMPSPSIRRPSSLESLPFTSRHSPPLHSVPVIQKNWTGPDGSFDESEMGSAVSSQHAEITMRLPPLPGGALEGPFICTVCSRKHKRLFKTNEWRTHVMADIEPYICIYEDCPNGDAAYRSTQLCMTHQELDHGRQPITICPLCDVPLKPDKSESRRQRHIFKHMETIGLFSLPSYLRDIDEEGRTLSSTVRTAATDSATGSIGPDETKPDESSRWAQLKQEKVEAGNSEFGARLKDVRLTRYDYVANRWLLEIPDEESGAPPKSLASQSRVEIRAPIHDHLEHLLETEMDWTMLRGLLSVVDQDKHRSTISPFNRNEPGNFWISKNIDFTQWESANDSRALLLSAPPGHRTTEICSHFIDLAKASQTNSSVLYFFSSTTTAARCSTVFTHTLLYQIVHYSNGEKANSIAATFLSTLLGKHFQRRSQVLRQDDPLDSTIKKILDAPDDELIEALAEAIKKAGIQELSIIVDGLWGNFAYWLVKHIMKATPKLKALLTSGQIPNLGEMIDGMLYIEYDKERQECLRSLQYDDTFYDTISEEHHGSLEWLWRHPQYLQWSASATSSLLYIEGKPGSGKSTLVKYLVKNLVQVPNASSSTVAHYFYTFRGTILESTHENMLRSILHSILEQDESTFFHFQQEFRKFHHRNLSKWPYDSLKIALSSFAKHPSSKPLCLILDAMDESEEHDRRSIIQLLCNLCSEENPCSIKIFLASRPIPELKHHIQEHPLVITLQDVNKHDISRFAVCFLEKEIKLTGKILGEAADYIIGNADGVFVWVGLVKTELLRLVETGCTDAEILHCLKDLPPDLEEFYTLMFARLEKGHQRDIRIGKKLFRFVMFARRPLTVIELRHALAIPDDHIPYEEFQQSIIRDTRRRIEYCGGNFLEIKADETVQFMHQTAREFLIRTIPDALKFQFEITDKADRTITTTLVQYLTFCFTSPRMHGFSKITSWSPEDFRAYAEYLNEWPLIEYTFRYINDHHDLGGPNEDVSQLVTELIGQLADNQASYFFGSFLNFRFGNNYGIAFPLNEYQETSENMKYSTLNAAADPKLPHVLEALLLTCTQDAPHAQRKTPLIISVQKGLARATQLLLDLDDDKDTKDDSGRTALHYAAENGDEAIVQLLVEKGADKRIRDNSKETALHIAVKKFPNDS